MTKDSEIYVDNYKILFFRWGIVIHGCIDGFSRMITFLKASNNNKSITVFDNFIDATKEFGLPSRIRCDHGVENFDVCTYMEGVRGANRGSAIKGKSCHNQRIERLWVDVWENVTNEFYDLFSYMEFENILDVTKKGHMFALYFVFLPRINERLKSFIFQYNNHPLSTEHNKKPIQLFIQGVLMNTSNVSVRELVHQAGNNNTEALNDLQEYGVDHEYEEDVESSEEEIHPENTLNADSSISEDEFGQLRQEIDPLMQKYVTVYGVQLFQKVIDFVQRFSN